MATFTKEFYNIDDTQTDVPYIQGVGLERFIVSFAVARATTSGVQFSEYSAGSHDHQLYLSTSVFGTPNHVEDIYRGIFSIDLSSIPLGWTATATSPNIVSGRVVATVI